MLKDSENWLLPFLHLSSNYLAVGCASCDKLMHWTKNRSDGLRQSYQSLFVIPLFFASNFNNLDP